MKNSYRGLVVWQKSMVLVKSLYEATSAFPPKEIYGLTSQIRRCGISIPSNIAEGKYRSSEKEFVQFLRMAYSSGAELETQLEIALMVGYLFQKDYNKLVSELEEIMKMLNALIRKIK